MAKRSKALIEFLGKQPGPALAELAFQCPDCGGCELNHIQTVVRVIMDVTCVYKDPLSESGEDVYEEVDQVFFECACCGYRLEDDSGYPVVADAELVAWLKENCQRESE